MKCLLSILALCLVAVQARPDQLIKLDEGIDVAATITEEITTSTVSPTEAATEKPERKYNGTLADRERLVAALFKDYNKKVIPDLVKVKFGMALLNFRVNEQKQTLETQTWVRQVWTDERLRWNKEDFGGVDVIRYDSDDVWKPDVTLYNVADATTISTSCWHADVLIYPNGEVLWVPPCKFSSECNYTLAKEPYGEQSCTMKFGSWTNDGYIMDLGLYGEKTNSSFDLSDLRNNSGFEIVSHTSERKETFYSCCPEPYPSLTFNMTIKRIPGEQLLKKM